MDITRVQSFVSCLPEWFRHYAALHVDTIPKLINHLLVVMGFCNVILILSCINVSFLPDMGMNSMLIGFLLCSQTACLWVIFNNSRYPSLSALAPTEFMVGNSLGITIGGALLALVLANYFHRVSKCDTVHESMQEYYCAKGVRSALSAVSFWSFLVFWLECCIALLIAMGRTELTNIQQYENLSMNDHEEHFRRYAENHPSGTIPGTFSGSIPGFPFFVGDYSSVPEIRTQEQDQQRSSSSEAT